MAFYRCCQVLILLLAVLSAPGCVRRRLTIRSNPPGALVYVDDQQIGTTPVSANFTYYGVRKIQLIKDGHEILTVRQDFRPPWYQIPPLDFFSENLAMQEVRDERILDFQLVPMQIVPDHILRSRAEALRNKARQGLAVPTQPPIGRPGQGLNMPLPRQ